MPTAQLPHAVWRKSTHSSTQEGACVEVAALPAIVAVRDSKDPDGGHLEFDRSAFATLAGRIRSGELDL